VVDTDRTDATFDQTDQTDSGDGSDDQPREVHVSPEERTALLAAGAPKVPRRVVVWGFAVAAILALGGTAAERLVSAAGLNPTSSPVTTSTTSPLTGSGPSAGSALLSFVRLPAVRAPRVVLLDQHGQPVSIGGAKGKVTVLTFFDASCADACPVIATEIRHADADLGPLRSRVVFLTVNTDPLALNDTGAAPAITATGLGSLPNWHFLSGTVHTLNSVWNAFGVSISVYVDTKVVVHNDVLYLVDPRGDLVSRGSPFSDESHRGVFSLPASLERVAAHGLASAAAALLAPPHR
jgi:cytochrome oxidase Cu insertion factor (SCO1/SenC/PrrC family)